MRLNVGSDCLEVSRPISEGYLDHPELTTEHTFYIGTVEGGGIEVSCSHDARARPGGLSGDDYGTEVCFTIPPDEAPDFVAALQAWIEQL